MPLRFFAAQAEHVDDDLRRLAAHMRIHGPHQIDVTEHLEVPCLPPACLIHAENVTGWDRAGIVHQDIDIPVRIGDGLGGTALREINGLSLHRSECRELDQRFLQPVLIA